MANRRLGGMSHALDSRDASEKRVAHNLVVVIHEMYEFGIDPTIGAAAREDEPRNVLRFVRQDGKVVKALCCARWSSQPLA